MKRLASFFKSNPEEAENKQEIVYFYIDYITKDKSYKVYERKNKIDMWGDSVETRSTLEEAMERSLKYQRSQFCGLYRNGKLMSADYIEERKEADANVRLQKQAYRDYEKDKKIVYEGVPEKDRVWLKNSNVRELEIPVEIERKTFKKQ